MVEYHPVEFNEIAYDIVFAVLKGKYLQSIHSPSIICQVGNLPYSHESEFSAFNPIKKRSFPLPLKNLRNFAIISKEQYDEYVADPSKLQNIVLIRSKSPSLEKKASS